MRERRAVVEATAERYRRSRKKEKQRILDEFTELTGYNRSYARFVLRNWGKRVHTKGRVYKAGTVGRRRPERQREYDDRVLEVLRRVWVIMDYICGKRLVSVLGETVERLERFGEITESIGCMSGHRYWTRPGQAVDSERRSRGNFLKSKGIDRFSPSSASGTARVDAFRGQASEVSNSLRF
jgi:hypothetical protein